MHLDLMSKPKIEEAEALSARNLTCNKNVIEKRICDNGKTWQYSGYSVQKSDVRDTQ